MITSKPHLNLLIRGGHVIGASDAVSDVLVCNGRIAAVAKDIPVSAGMSGIGMSGIDQTGVANKSCDADATHIPDIIDTTDFTVIDASGLIVAPGLVDMHVHFRDPGFEYKEDILTGAAAAVSGGITTCCCMPNTSPVADNAQVLSYIIDKAKETPVTLHPYGAVTLGQKGLELTDFAALKAAGAIALSDDGNPIQSEEVTKRAMNVAREQGLLISSHCEDAELVRNYAVNEGKISRQLGIPGRPAAAEEMMVARDVKLAAETGARIHIAHVSTAGSVAIIREAKAKGIAVTAETCPQYFTLTEDEVLRQGALARVNPPLRLKSDVEAIIEGLIDGTIDAVATDHAPHSVDEKAQPLTEALSGMIGLETSLALSLTYLFHTGHISLEKLSDLLSINPASILGLRDSSLANGTLDTGALCVGSSADIVIFDPNEEWVVDPAQFKSKARNTPFAGMKLQGRAKYTISRGRVVFRD